MAARDRLVVALDLPDLEQARDLVRRLGEEVLWFKVGLELFSAAGPSAVEMLKSEQKRVFLDLKLHDIPNTVARAVARIARTGADLIDMHTSAGAEAMELAARTLRESVPAGARPRLLGVTVLTSSRRLSTEGEELTPQRLTREVTDLAAAAQAAGLDGVVAPALTIEAVRERCGEAFDILSPGIRPAGSAREDQQWVATPASAVAAGARWIVIGRPITAAPDPPAAAREICEEMGAAAI